MVYMNVMIKTDQHLVLLRKPSFTSKLVFSGFVIGVLGVLIFVSETLVFKALIAFSAMLISTFIVDNYESLFIDKQNGMAKITRMHFCQYLMNRLLPSQPYISFKVADIKEVRVENKSQGEKNKMHRVVLALESGVLLGVTEVFTRDALSEQENIADVISTFIRIGNEAVSVKNQDTDDNDKQKEEVADSSSDDDGKLEDDFEKITQAEIDKIENREVPEMTAGGDTLDNTVDKDQEEKEITSEVQSQSS